MSATRSLFGICVFGNDFLCYCDPLGPNVTRVTPAARLMPALCSIERGCRTILLREPPIRMASTDHSPRSKLGHAYATVWLCVKIVNVSICLLSAGLSCGWMLHSSLRKRIAERLLFGIIMRCFQNSAASVLNIFKHFVGGHILDQ